MLSGNNCRNLKLRVMLIFAHLGAINRKFTAIFAGASKINPTEEEMSESEVAWEKMQNVLQRMNQFVQMHVFQKN